MEVKSDLRRCQSDLAPSYQQNAVTALKKTGMSSPPRARTFIFLLRMPGRAVSRASLIPHVPTVQ